MLVAVVISFLAGVFVVQTEGNECIRSSPYSHIERRNWEYKLGSGEQSVPDYFIDNSLEIWYGTTGVNLWTQPPGYGSCGCKFPVWMRDRNVNGSGMAEMCLQVPTNECDRTWTINAIDCGTHSVYQLLRTPVFDSAYCIGFIGQAPPPLTITPEVFADIVSIPGQSTPIIYCDFDFPRTDLFYQVIWYVNNNHVHSSAILETSASFRNQTALTEVILQGKGISRFGFAVNNRVTRDPIFYVNQTHCEVIARTTALGRPGPAAPSARKFLGIKVDKWSLTVTNNEPETIYLETTAPIGCGSTATGTCLLPVEVHVTESTKSATPYNPRAFVKSLCGVVLNGTDPKRVPLTVIGEELPTNTGRSGITKIRLQTAELIEMPFWDNTYIGEVTVTVHRTSTLADGRSCYVYLDPHVKPFDRGNVYSFMHTGLYTVFKHTSLPIQVQMRFGWCGTSATCGTAFAVRVGQAVFRIYRHFSRWTADFSSCEADTIIVKSIGKNYMIYLPTGMYIKVNIIHSNRIDAYLYPSSEDVRKASGLCGNLNGISSDDQSGSWGVPTTEDLFIDANLPNLASYPHDHTYCTCERDGAPGDIHPEITCSPQLNKIKVNRPWSGNPIGTNRDCFIRGRKRRSAKYPDEHFVRKRETSIDKTKEVTPLSESWDENRARDYCNLVFNTSSAIKACAAINDTDAEENIENCVHDVQQMQSPEIALEAVEASKTTCLIGAMVDADIQNETEPGAGTIFEQINAVICPNDCSGQGVCSNGTCDCEENYGAIDCSVKLNDPPVTYGLDNSGYCDVMNETCDEAMVFTEYIVHSKDAKCKLQPFTIDFTNEEIVKDTVTVDPDIVIFTEAICKIPQERQERSVTDPPSSASWKGYRVSIANDGVTFSKQDIFITYNSECQRCTISGNSVQCEFVTQACISNGACVKPGEFHPTIPCYKCDEQVAGKWIRAEGAGCSDLQHHTQSLLWIIGAVVGGIILCVIVLGLAWIISRKNKQKIAADNSGVIGGREAWPNEAQLPPYKAT